jgi:hypothetical protein
VLRTTFLRLIAYVFSIDWAQHGICGRGVLLDLAKNQSFPNGTLPYDPWSTHAFTVGELEACATSQGVTLQPADILIVRIGWIKKYTEATKEERDALANKPEKSSVTCLLDEGMHLRRVHSAGVEQSEEMKRFLWYVTLTPPTLMRMER